MICYNFFVVNSEYGVLQMKKVLKVIGIIILFIAVAGIAAILAFNIHTIYKSHEYIYEAEDFDKFYADYIMVLGCAVKPDGTPSDMLADRMSTGTKLFNKGHGEKLLITGDSEFPKDYDETEAMKQIALEDNIEKEHLIIDPVGLSTYESIVRAKDQLKGKTVIIVTQKYHLYRAVYVARSLGLDAYGCCADVRTYSGQIYREMREWIGRVKDEVYLLFDVKPTYGTEIELIKYTVTETEN